jgi:hypothetical protein
MSKTVYKVVKYAGVDIRDSRVRSITIFWYILVGAV